MRVGVTPPPAGVSPELSAYLLDLHSSLERVIGGQAPGFKHVDMHSDTGRYPLVAARRPEVIRGVVIQAPFTVPPNSRFFTLLDVLVGDHRSTKSIRPNRRPFSTSDGLDQWRSVWLVQNDDEGEVGLDFKLDAGQTLYLAWTHVQNLDGVGLSTLGEQELDGQPYPDEIGSLLTNLYVQADREAT